MDNEPSVVSTDVIWKSIFPGFGLSAITVAALSAVGLPEWRGPFAPVQKPRNIPPVEWTADFQTRQNTEEQGWVAPVRPLRTLGSVLPHMSTAAGEVRTALSWRAIVEAGGDRVPNVPSNPYRWYQRPGRLFVPHEIAPTGFANSVRFPCRDRR